MKPESGQQLLTKTWIEYTHENGSRVLDFELLHNSGTEQVPIVGVYGLSPAAVAAGVMAQREVRDIHVKGYVDILFSPIDAFEYGHQATYH